MKKTDKLKKLAVLVLGFAFTLGSAACGEGLITTDNEKDMAQTVASVDLSRHGDFKTGGKYAAYADAIKNDMNHDIYKRDLVAYFLNVGVTYVQQYGQSMSDTIRMLMSNLVSRKIMVQYAMAYYFDEGAKSAEESKYSGKFSAEKYSAYVENELEKIEDKKEKELCKAHPEVLAMKYFLTNGGLTAREDTADYDRAVYSLKKMINNTLDSAEDNYIEEEDDEYTETTPRTTPTDVGTNSDDYYDTQYEIYTGRQENADYGSYEKKEGSTKITRGKAYNDFLASLSVNGLLGKGEDTTDFTKVDYYYVELASQLEQALLTKYTEDLTEKANEMLTREYVEDCYAELVKTQQNRYDADQSAFETDLDSLSDDSFVAYSPKEGFGFVYNILLKFSTTQSQTLSANNSKGLTPSEIKGERAKMLEKVQGKDLRDTWFSEHDEHNYAYAVQENYYQNGKNSNYLFFEDNFTKSKDTETATAEYKELKQYYGQYPYNGTAEQDEETGEWTLTPNKLGIDEFLTEMENYFGYAGLTANGEKCGNYVSDGNYTLENPENPNSDKFDYSEFIYYEGKVDDVAQGIQGHNEFFVKDTSAYKAASVFNELMFAYSEDPGCLNKYMGYTISAYKTSFVPEFEYAAQYAVQKGAGTYVVCPSDYGWHIIYVTFAYDASGEVYSFNYDDIEKEGSFSNLYYESLKKTNSDNYTDMIQNQVLNEYTDSCSTLYEKNYKNLLG